MVGLIVRQEGIADNLTAVVEPVRKAAGATQGSDVCHGPLVPQERILCWDAWWTERAVVGVRSRAGVGLAGYLAVLVDGESKGVGPAQSADIPHGPVFLQEEGP